MTVCAVCVSALDTLCVCLVRYVCMLMRALRARDFYDLVERCAARFVPCDGGDALCAFFVCVFSVCALCVV